MDILDRYLGYETWTFRYFLDRCHEVSAAKLHEMFDIGQGTLFNTIAHTIENIEVWTDLIHERPVREVSPLPDDIDACLERFDAAIADFTDYAQQLAASNRLDDTYLDVLDKPPTRKTFGGTILHVLTHITVHRWEMQHILQRLDVENLIEGDALGWEQRAQRQP